MILYDCFREGATFDKKTDGAAGYDLTACLDGSRVLQSFTPTLIPLGVRVDIPEGYVGLLTLRSSASKLYRAATNPGIIDSDYRGELMIPLRSGFSALVKNGERIAQLVIVPVCTQSAVAAEISEDSTRRGAGGFGSTGT